MCTPLFLSLMPAQHLLLSPRRNVPRSVFTDRENKTRLKSSVQTRFEYDSVITGVRIITCQRALTSLLIHTPHAMNHEKTITWEQMWVYISRSWMICAIIWWQYKLHTTFLPCVEQTFSITGTDLILHVLVVCSGRIVSISLRLGTSTPGQRLMQGN